MSGSLHHSASVFAVSCKAEIFPEALPGKTPNEAGGQIVKDGDKVLALDSVLVLLLG
jgi:hypothetical protein